MKAESNRETSQNVPPTIIPAQPGWYMMTVVLTDALEFERVIKTSVLAWMIFGDLGWTEDAGAHAGAIPITAFGVPRGYEVLCDPSGQFQHWVDGVFADEDEAIRYLIDEVTIYDMFFSEEDSRDEVATEVEDELL